MPNTNNSFNISFTFRHSDSSDALKTYATEKLIHCVSKYINHHADIHVILDIERRDHIAEINLTSKGFDTTAKAVSEDSYSAIDKVIHKVDDQLRRQKGKAVEQKHASSPV